MVIVTGAAGFIGSCLVSQLNQAGIRDIVVSDDFTKKEKERNLSGKLFYQEVPREELHAWVQDNANIIDFIIHIGARTDTTEFNREIFYHLNLDYTQQLWNLCVKFNIPLIYASSAATYGLGEYGYDDTNEDVIYKLKPLNPYGESKNDFDRWALQQAKKPPYWVGLKFFNVYGPNEYHKGRMASVIFHAFNQIKQGGKVKLFRSHTPHYKDGQQLRDFIYVKDVCTVILHLYKHRAPSGIYNLGTGKARTFEDLARSTFKAMGLPENIEYIDTPLDIRDKYQYFTEAKMDKLKNAGYNKPFYTLEEGVEDYVKNYLTNHLYF